MRDDSYPSLASNSRTEDFRCGVCMDNSWRKCLHRVLLWGLSVVLALSATAFAQERLSREEVLVLMAQGPAKGSDKAPVNHYRILRLSVQLLLEILEGDPSPSRGGVYQDRKGPVRLPASGHPGSPIRRGGPGSRLCSGTGEVLGLPRHSLRLQGPVWLHGSLTQTICPGPRT